MSGSSSLAPGDSSDGLPDERSSGPRVALRFLGPAVVTLSGEPVPGLASDKVVALLAFLALRPGPHDRDLLADLLWGDMPQQRARASLRTALYSAQKALGDPLAVTRKSAGWDAARLPWVDVLAFLAATEPPAEGAAAERAGGLAEAEALWRGELLEGLRVEGAATFDAWLGDQRAELGLRRMAALERLVEVARQAGDGPSAEMWLRRLLRVAPWHEAGHRRLMHQLARRGDHAAALKQYEDCRAALQAELDVEPDASTRALARRIEAARGRGPRARQALPPDALVGRETALARLEGLLLDPAVRLLSLVGPGGVGKTRLALEAAHGLAFASIDGASFVALAGAEDGTAFESTLAGALGLELSPSRPVRRQILEHLRDQERLLVLDNMEQLQGEAAWIRHLLDEALDLTVLITSRVRLGLDLETLFPLDGLDPPADPDGGHPEGVDPAAAGLDEVGLGTEALAQLERSPAVRLFLREARKVRPSFSLAEEGAAVAEICRRLGGLPLGIRLAAALVDLEPASALAADLREDLDPLATSRPDVPERHHSLRRVFEHSWRLLDEGERDALQGLSLFQDPFTAADASTVVGLGAGALRGLLDKSVIQRLVWDEAEAAADGESSTSRAARVEGPRFRIHASVRHFAAERLAADPARAAEIRARYRSHVAGLLEHGGRALRGPEMLATRRALESRYDDLRQAWRFAVADGDAAALERGLDGLILLHELRATIDAANDLVTLAWERAADWERGALPNSAASRLPLRLRVSLAKLAVGRVRYDEAVAHAEQAIAACDRAEAQEGDRPRERWMAEIAIAVRAVLGHALWRKGDYGAAGEVLEEADHRLGDLRPEAPGWLRRAVRGSLGTVNRYLGRYEEALRYGEGLLADALAEGDAWAVALSHQSLGVYAHEAGDFASAREAGEAALASFRELGHRRGVGNALNNLANVYADVGDHVRSAAALREALAIFRALGDRWGEAMVLNNLGMETLEAGDPGDALGRFQEAVRHMRLIGNRQGEAMAINNLGIAWGALGEPERALEACAEALAAYEETGDRRGVAMAHCDLSELRREDDPMAAVDHAEVALEIAREVGDRQTEARGYAELARARQAVGDPTAAIAAFDEAIGIRRALAQDEPVLLALAGRAEARAAAGDAAGAVADARDVAAALGQRNLAAWGDPFTPSLAVWRVLGVGAGGGEGVPGSDQAPRADEDRATAERVLREARALLERRAQRLVDPVRRRGYLEGVAAHRALCEAG